SYTFTLLNPIANGPNQSETSATLDLSGLIKAVDFDGTTVPLVNDFKITVTDDTPVLTGQVDTAHAVDEAGLLGATTVGDLYGTGNNPGGASAVATGSLAALGAFGAAGPPFERR